MGRPSRKRAKTSSNKDTASTSTENVQSPRGGSSEFVTKKDLEQLVNKLLAKQSPTKHSTAASKHAPASDSSSEDNSDMNPGSESDSEITFSGEQKGFKSTINGQLTAAQKDKIWSFQYVKFKSILPPSHTAGDEDRDFEDLQFGKTVTGGFKLRTKSTKDINITFKEWNDAFDVLASTIIEKFPRKSQQLIKYRMDIRHAYSTFRGNAWRDYDEKFRRKHNGVDSDWGAKDTDEWLNVFTAGNKDTKDQTASKGREKSTQGAAGKSVGVPGRILTCNQYNKGLACRTRPCRYHHLCEGCKGNHPIFACNTTSQQSHGQSQRSFRPAGQQIPTTIPTTTSGVVARKP